MGMATWHHARPILITKFLQSSHGSEAIAAARVFDKSTMAATRRRSRKIEHKTTHPPDHLRILLSIPIRMCGSGQR